MEDVVKIRVGYAYMPMPPLKTGAHNRRKWCYYVNDNGSLFTYGDLVTATDMAISLFRGYHKSGRMVQITNY